MTKKEKAEFLAQLTTNMSELKTEIDNAKNDLKTARSLKTKIEGVETSSQALLDKLSDPSTGIDAKLDEGQKNVEAINTDAVSASEVLKTIEATLGTANAHVQEMETAYEGFIAIKAQIDDPATGLAETLNTVKKLRQQAKAASTSTDTLLNKAEKTLEQVNTYITNMNTAYAEFELSKKKIDDPNNGLDAVLEASQKLRDDIKAVAETAKTPFAQINKYRDESSNALKDIKKNKDDSGTALENIKNNLTASEDAKKNIETLLKISSQQTSTAYFKKRTRFVTIVAGVWLVLGIAALVVAVCLGHQIINDIQNIKDNSAVQLPIIVARAVIVTPIIAFAFYAFRNYGKERNVAEQYAFKEISGATLEGHIEMARRSLPKAAGIEDKLVESVAGVIKDIHTEPSELQKSSKLSVKATSKLLDIGAEVSEIGENVDDIKDAVINVAK